MGPQFLPKRNPNSKEGAGSSAQGTSQPENSHENCNRPILFSSKNSHNQNTPPGRPRRAHAWAKDYYMIADIFNEDEDGFAMYIAVDDRLTYKESRKVDKWIQAMNAEMTAIERNNTW